MIDSSGKFLFFLFFPWLNVILSADRVLIKVKDRKAAAAKQQRWNVEILNLARGCAIERRHRDEIKGIGRCKITESQDQMIAILNSFSCWLRREPDEKQPTPQSSGRQMFL